MKILQSHYKELKASGIHDDIINLNFESISGQDALETLLWKAMEDLGKGQTVPHSHQYTTGEVARVLKRYDHINAGGWWCSGLDPLNDWRPDLWGCFKPDNPRRDFNNPGKIIKYEHNPKLPTRAFFLRVSWKIGLKIAKKAKAEKSYRDRLPENVDWAAEDYRFWEWVLDNNISIVITEGAKKAASLLSAGYATIGLPGVTGAVRTKGKNNEQVDPFLIPEIQLFVTEGRRIDVLFDYETKQKTIKNVQREISKLGDLLTRAKCDCRIIELPGPEKGIDDFLVAHGEEALDKLYECPPEYRFWEFNQSWKLTFTRNVVINSRYFGDIDYGDERFCCIKGGMGTGKTKSLEKRVRAALAKGQKVLVPTHRIELGRAICAAIGLNWVDECNGSVEGRIFGFGFCVDSCHLLSQARIDPTDWEGALVIIDEVEQVLWHLFNSATCSEKRAVILRTFEELIQTVLKTGGSLIIQDADLSDYSINYFIEISGIENLKPFVIENIYKGKGRDVTYYTNTMEAGYGALDQKISNDKRVIVFLDSQKIKGKMSAINLECQIKKNHPDKKVLRIDSQTVSDPNHPAFACAKRINDLIPEYDVVIATPTIGTGVSIDIRGHFDAVFGFFKGAIASNDVMQMMNRLRDENAEWHLWVAPYGCSKVGNGSSNDWILWTSKDKVTRKNLELLNQADRSINLEFGSQIDPRHTRAWAKFGARINAGQWNYRSTVYHLLIAANHRVKLSTDSQLKIDDQVLATQEIAAYNSGNHDEADRIEAERAKIEQELEIQKRKNKKIRAEANQIRLENRLNRAKKVVATPKPDKKRYDELKDKRAKTPDELLEEEKYRISETYQVEVTEELVLKDEDGWYSKIRTDYFMRNPEKVLERDRKHLEAALENGEGNTTLQDLKLLTAKIELLRALGALELLNGETYTKDSPEVQRAYSILLAAPWDVKNFIGFLPSPNKDPIRTINDMFSSTIGAKLEGRQIWEGGERKRGYTFIGYKDGREAVWDAWGQKEQEYQERLVNEGMGITPGHIEDLITDVITDQLPDVIPESNTPEIIDPPVAVPVAPAAPEDGWVLAPPDKYWEEVMAYIYQGSSPIKQWIGKFVEVVSQAFQVWADSPWFVRGWIRDGMGNRSEVVLPLALIG